MIIADRRCGTCRFKCVEDDHTFTCRYDPPVAQTIVVVGPKGPQTLGVVASWPPVREEQYCHKWERGLIQ